MVQLLLALAADPSARYKGGSGRLRNSSPTRERLRNSKFRTRHLKTGERKPEPGTRKSVLSRYPKRPLRGTSRWYSFSSRAARTLLPGTKLSLTGSVKSSHRNCTKLSHRKCCLPPLSHRKWLYRRFAKVNSLTNSSTYPLLLLI